MSMALEADLEAALAVLAEHAAGADGDMAWPATSWEALRRGEDCTWKKQLIV